MLGGGVLLLFGCVVQFLAHNRYPTTPHMAPATHAVAILAFLLFFQCWSDIGVVVW